MQQRDILKDQIEQLGQAIGKAISLFLGLKSKGEAAQGVVAANEVFRETLKLDIEELLKWSSEELNNYFFEKLYTADQIEELADYLFAVGQHENELKSALALNYYETALALLELAGSKSKIFSLARRDKENEWKQQMDKMK